MRRSQTASFITELPLVVDSKTEKKLLAKFQAGRQLYNACLHEAMVKMKRVKNSDAYIRAKKFPKEKAKTAAFKEARSAYRYSEYELHSFATFTSKKSKWIAENIDSNTQQKLATRAFNASEKVLLGRAKKVRFKVPSRFRSLEGKTNKQGIRFKNGQLVWGSLKITPIIDWLNPVIKHGLDSKIKYVRILWRELKGKRRWYVQLINEGLPYQKPQNYVSNGLIGLDLNISNIAFVGNNMAGLLPFALDVPTYQKEIKRLQRQMERSRRNNNPSNYYPDFKAKKGRKVVTKKGKSIKGKHKWNNSQTYLKTTAKKQELERKKTAYAKSQNRQIVNEILRHGKHLKTENVSVKGWQKRYGKAIGAKSPGFVQSELRRKAENAGGVFQKFSTRKTALSQTHLNGERIKKSLSQRVHYDLTGVIMHRDLFSAFLARHINDEDNLLLQSAQKEWIRLESVLKSAWQEFQINRKQVSASESRQGHFPLERFDLKLEDISQISCEGLKANDN
ncbi:MAG: RNA-guided endonuclease TnpB family protein, partial [Waterburya sp.]